MRGDGLGNRLGFEEESFFRLLVSYWSLTELRFGGIWLWLVDLVKSVECFGRC